MKGVLAVLVRFGLLGIPLFVLGFAGLQMLLHAAHVDRYTGALLLIPLELALYAAIVILTERRRVGELDPRSCLPHTGAGFAAGIALFSAAIVVLLACGCYRVLAHHGPSVVLAPLVMWTSAAIAEELLFRGFVFRILQNIGGTWIALAASSALFGLAHAFNHGSTIWSCMAIALQAGIMLGLAYTLTRKLWLPIGIHAGWNFAEGTLYGTPVSGTHFGGNALVLSTLHGPVLLTGGAFGVEASIEATAVCLAASLILYVLCVRKNRIVPFGVNRAPLVEPSAA